MGPCMWLGAHITDAISLVLTKKMPGGRVGAIQTDRGLNRPMVNLVNVAMPKCVPHTE